MTDVDTVTLALANRLYMADIEIAERTLARANEAPEFAASQAEMGLVG